MQRECLFLFLSLLAVSFVDADVSAPVDSRQDALVGSYRPIRNLKDPHIIEIAEFAVSEHNKQAAAKLVFVKVVKGESQVVAGVNFRLVIEAKDGDALEDYEAVVYERPWEKYKSLTSFKKA
ncbi:hypothetical protein Nepgr_028705 [Nepenthes gracilis]|uniref:Cystatin domain-containing protein n=1 Tax=Nepenthes gracilis TaxID=150966 RepID=A0AAD3Y2C6_NEPGR|nr:hypothetical protein Nepgr_028705 [Nepenthes gracilis]